MHSLPGGAGLPAGFAELPALVYGRDPDWIPEDPLALARAFGPHNPWFAQGEAATFCLPGQARAAAFFQPALRVEGRPVAFFGYWDTTGDAAADRALFEAVAAWAAERGAQALYGPIDFTTYGNYRLRLSAEPDAKTFPDEPYNPPRYPDHLEALGFVLDQHYLTQVGRLEEGRLVREWKRPRQEALLADGFSVQTLSHAAWMDNLRGIHRLVDAVFGGNFAYSPLSWAAFEAKCGLPFIRRADPDVSVIAFDPEGAVAGFFLVYPHYGPIAAQGAEDRVPASRLDFATHWPRLAELPWRGAVAKTVGVAPEHRRKGVMDALTVGIFERGDPRYPHWFGAMIKKGNPSRNYADGNILSERWYGLYRKEL